jgi:DNA-binding GntR family transcriptional regulator
MIEKNEILIDTSFPKTLSQHIYKSLKESIIFGKIKANQRIIDKEIAKQFQVSTTPVREAILMLRTEGLVTIKSHKEVVVKELSVDELKEICEVLNLLESNATALFLEQMGEEDIKNIEQIHSKMAAHCRNEEIEEYCYLNSVIHKKLWEFIPNKFLQKALSDAHVQFQRYSNAQLFAMEQSGVLDRSLIKHEEILNALKNRDKNRLKRLLAQHWGVLLYPPRVEKRVKGYFNLEKSK